MVLETHAPGDGGGLLCRRHADALTVPRGWSLDDRRDPVPRLFRVPESSVPPSDATPSRGQRRRASRETGPTLLDVVSVEQHEPTAERSTVSEGSHMDQSWSGDDETEPIEAVEDEPHELRYERDEDETWADAVNEDPSDDDPWPEETY